MKTLGRKILVSIILMALLFSNSILLIVSNATENVEGAEKVKALLDIKLNKYVNYKLDETNKGVILELDSRTGIETKEDVEYSPIKKSETNMNLPVIEGQYPEKVVVITKSTKATNGKNANEEVQYNYNKENGELKIQVLNEKKENEEVYNSKDNNARDYFRIICYYSASIYYENNKEREIEVKGHLIQELHNENKVENSSKGSIKLSENISDIVSATINNSEIYNGYITANSMYGTGYETIYNENMELNISVKDLEDEIEIESNNFFVDNKDKEIQTDEIVYKSSRINKWEVLNILGENGNLKILDKDGKAIGEINKDTKEENGYVEVKYGENISEIKISTTKPVKEGSIYLDNTKAIKSTMKNTNCNKIKTTNNIELRKITPKTEEKEEIIEKIYETKSDNITEIKDAETRIDVEIDKKQLTNKMQNDVNFNVTLVSNNSKYNLFKNPVIEIELPKEVEKVILGNISLLHTDEVNISKAEVVEKNGQKVIQIQLLGEQKEYNVDNIVKGIDVVISAKIILEKEFGSKKDNIRITYNNEIGKQIDYKKADKEYKEIEVSLISEVEEQAPINKVQAPSVPNAPKITDEDISKVNVEVKAEIGEKQLKDGDIVYEEQVIKYTVKATNNSNKTIENININTNIPEGTTYGTVDIGSYYANKYEYVKDTSVKTYEIPIEKLVAGESKEEFYEVVIEKLADGVTTKNIKADFSINIEGKDLGAKSINNVINKAELKVELKSYIGRDQDNSFYYEMDITNLTNSQLNNIEAITSKFQTEMKYDISNFTVVYYGIENIDEIIESKSYENNVLKTKIKYIEAGKTIKLLFNLTVGDFEDKINVKQLLMTSKAITEGKSFYDSNENRRDSYPEYVTVKMTSPQEGENIKYEEEIEYNISIKNESKIRTNVKITDYLPAELDGEVAKYKAYEIQNQEDYKLIYDMEKEANLPCNIIEREIDLSLRAEERADIDIEVIIPAGKTLDINIKTKAGIVAEKTEIANFVTITGKYINTVTSNIIKMNILPIEQEPVDPEDPDNPNPPIDPENPDKPVEPEDPDKTSYNINGLVWIDTNKNGKREESEQKLEGILVKLYNSKTGTLVQDKNGNAKISQTNVQGEYKFDNVEVGEYLVLFKYNTQEYYITEYRASGIEDDVNSDAILKTVSIDGQEQEVGITDTINVIKSDVRNIDMGLIKNGIFDLSLKKYINKVTVQNAEGNKEYKYDNTQLGKIEINPKYLNNTKVAVEYKIVVTNEGERPGYVTEIIDYLPKELEFVENLNKGWTKSNSGTISSVSLSGTKIYPGESKEIILILNKTMNQESVGTVTNGAEIGKVYNSENGIDKDSTPGNKNKQEDDYSEAQLIIGIKTGIVEFTIGIIGSLLVIALIIYLIRKKKIKTVMMLIFATIMTTSILSNTVKSVIINETGLWSDSYRDSSGNYYDCMDDDFAQCYASDHEYTKYDEIVHSSSTHTNTLKKLDMWKDNEPSIKVQSNGLVGRYDVYSNYSGKMTVEVSYTTKDGTTKSVNISNATNNNGAIQLVGWDGIKVTYFTLDKNGNTFYIKYSSDVIKINHVKVSNYVTDVTEYVTEKTISALYYCNWISGYTNYGSDLHLNNVKQANGWYLCKAAAYGSKYTSGGMAACQRMMGASKYSRTSVKSPATKIVTFSTPVVVAGNLNVTKQDKETGKKLSGATIRLTGPNGYNQSKVTNSNGVAQFTYIPIGSYTATETGAPSGYNLSLQASGDIKKSAGVSAGATSNITLYDIQYGNLTIRKEDKLSTDTLAGISFIIKAPKGWISSYTSGSPSSVSYTSSEGSAKRFVTSSSGTISLKNVPVGQYTIKEVELPDDLQGYYDVDSTPKNVNVKTNTSGTTNFTFVNIQKYVDVTGYVWDDGRESKDQIRNNLYDSGEKRVGGIPVKIKQGNTVKHSTTTASDGSYKFNKVLISGLSGYTVEFEYNGLKYQAVSTRISNSNGSKAAEKSGDRNSFNTSYSKILGGTDKTSSGTTGYSANGTTNTNRLSYTTVGTYRSELIQNQGYTSNNSNVVGQNGNTIVTKMLADTLTGGYILTHSPGQRVISNINMGMYEREQADIAIVNDIEKVVLGINGYTNTYTYSQRDAYLNQPQGATNDGFSVLTKVGNTYKNMTYTRGTYNSYVRYTNDISASDNNRLRMYVTYKMTIKNEATNLQASVNELITYYDSSYTLVNSKTQDNGSLSWTTTGTNNGYKVASTTGLAGKKMAGQSKYTIYLTFEINRDTIVSLINTNEVTLNNIVEIGSYSSYLNGTTYAAIDMDSAPNNVIPGNTTTYEDDTDSAPGLKINANSNKLVNGIAYEDKEKKSNNNLMINQERLGDGIYTSGENLLQGVKVELLNSENPSAKVYLYKAGGKTEAITTTNNKGEYDFTGLVPGKYTIKYTYGDGTVIYKNDGTQTGRTAKVQDYKSTISTAPTNYYTSNSPKWYLTNINGGIRYSDAFDDYAKRKEIDNSLANNLTNKGISNYTNGSSNKTMEAETSLIDVAIEALNNENIGYNGKTTPEYKNVDFGIVERARQSLNIEKEISYIKLVLANGQTMIEGDPRTGTLPYVTYPGKKTLKIELDNEIMQGSTITVRYEISVTNNSERDYDTEEYYSKGTKTGAIVGTDIEEMIEYIDEEMSTPYGSASDLWKLTTASELKDNGRISQEVYNTIKNRGNILVTNNLTNEVTTFKDLKPGATAIVKIEAVKTLSPDLEEMEYDNAVEIIKYKNSTGRIMENVGADVGYTEGQKATPGNYELGKENNSEQDNTDLEEHSKVVITPPTGQNRIYYTIGFIGLTIIIVGIVIIKKKVL